MQPKQAFLRLSEERKKELTEKAKDIYLTHPYEKITARMLLSVMDINPATFYRYFDSKDDLFLYLYKQIMAAAAKQINYDNVITTLYDSRDLLNPRDYDFVLLIFTIPESLVHRIYFDDEDYQNRFRQMLNAEKRAGLIREDMNLEFLSWYLLTNQYNSLIYYRRTHTSYDTKEQKEFSNYVMTDLVRNGYFKKDLPKL